jgi:hypothetical protein
MDAVLQSVLRGLVTYSTVIYILLSLGILLYLRRFVIGLREWQRSVFGLERRLTQRKLIEASTGLILLSLLVLGEFLLVTVVQPQMPAQPTEARLAVDTLMEPTETILPEEVSILGLSEESNIDQASLVSECIEDITEITYPTDGDIVSGTVEIIGSVNVDNFGSYKYEYSSTGNINWVTIAAGNQLKLDERIGYWYTSALPPGRYLLQLVPLNNLGEELTPCVVTVEVVEE